MKKKKELSKFSEYAGMLGRIKTKKKARASRKNGLLGGNPLKKRNEKKINTISKNIKI